MAASGEAPREASSKSAHDVFLDAVTGDSPYVAVLRGHTAVDALLHELIGWRMKDNRAWLKMRLNFGSRVNLAQALGILKSDVASALLRLGKIRNSLAHDVNRQVTLDDQRDLFNAMPPSIRDYEWKGDRIEATSHDALRSCITDLYLHLAKKRLAKLQRMARRLRNS